MDKKIEKILKFLLKFTHYEKDKKIFKGDDNKCQN